MISIGGPPPKGQINVQYCLVRPLVVQSIAIIKAAAIVNTRNKDLEPKLSKYIIRALKKSSAENLKNISH